MKKFLFLQSIILMLLSCSKGDESEDLIGYYPKYMLDKEVIEIPAEGGSGTVTRLDGTIKLLSIAVSDGNEKDYSKLDWSPFLRNYYSYDGGWFNIEVSAFKNRREMTVTVDSTMHDKPYEIAIALGFVTEQGFVVVKKKQ